MINKKQHIISGPLLDTITVDFQDEVNFSTYPFSLPLIKNLKTIEFPTNVTFFIGENGAGKSTLLEAIAHKAGFGAEGGSRNINFTTTYEDTYSPAQKLADEFIFSWRQKPKDGYFFRAESFYNVANYLENMTRENAYAFGPYGDKSLHKQSHGESFLAFFSNRLGGNGFFLFDEPEAALSPQRQLSLLVIINELSKKHNAQFIIATHSPILLAYPGATIYSCDGDTLSTIAYKETEHYRVTKEFLDDPGRYFSHLFKD